MDEVTWGALTLTLTLLGGGYTWWAFTHRGAAAGTRGAAVTLLPAAAWLTGTLRMFTEILGSVTDWATHLVFSPRVWLGIVLAGASALLFVASGRLRDRAGPRRSASVESSGGSAGLPPGKPARGEPVIDDDMAEIEAILRRRGIN